MTTEPCSAALSGDGYWTCDVVGGCRDCRSLARDAEDDYQIAEWYADRMFAKSQATVTISSTPLEPGWQELWGVSDTPPPVEGWVCAVCGKPSGMQGHRRCQDVPKEGS